MVTVNLTTTPARLPYIAPALDSLNKQSFQQFSITVWLPYEVDLRPLFLMGNDYKMDGILFKLPNKDYGPATKLISPLMDGVKGIIVTADDDVIYPENWLMNLYNRFLEVEKFKECAVGYRGKILDGKSYKESTCTYAKYNSEVDIITGTWGAMYKAEWFDVEELKQWLALNQPESHFCDDIVINAYLKSRGIGRYCIKSESEFKATKAHSINALWDINKDADYNDELIERLEL